jgi:serine/threonine protein phosphatase 1
MKVRYAIGDVHGEADKLARLHDFIADDIARHGAPALVVHLGDLVDRGADSRGVVERVIRFEANPPPGAEARSILGNHELMMLDAKDAATRQVELHWLTQGGGETMESYMRANGARADWREIVDDTHWTYLRGLPVLLRDDNVVFVHAGIDPARFPNCSDEIHLWTRSRKFFDEAQWPDRKETRDIVVLHGHTPTDSFEPEVSRRRINVDTGAVFGGPLTCVVLAPGETPRFLHAR